MSAYIFNYTNTTQEQFMKSLDSKNIKQSIKIDQEGYEIGWQLFAGKPNLRKGYFQDFSSAIYKLGLLQYIKINQIDCEHTF